LENSPGLEFARSGLCPVAAVCRFPNLDSSALTAGKAQSAEPSRRGDTMGLHSMAGYTGGFVGPLVVGLALDLVGHGTVDGWGSGFGHVAIVTLASLVVLRRLIRTGVSFAGPDR
jgi:hypothetical protein